ncbi:hypothetical protein G5714_024690 [Onychostoma macrolepis]|uniref:Uncharacterized protein n=1 Tax=Onychostoma macrolepis TaxID=369639 RepID=A0A7J6BHJ1_9TELE|nr:hypothetical protein G5714_024690 [Onychostoma macrolepis]
MSHSQFHCTGRVYLDLHGLIFETSICYWQDQPGKPNRATVGGKKGNNRSALESYTRVSLREEEGEGTPRYASLVRPLIGRPVRGKSAFRGDRGSAAGARSAEGGHLTKPSPQAPLGPPVPNLRDKTGRLSLPMKRRHPGGAFSCAHQNGQGDFALGSPYQTFFAVPLGTPNPQRPVLYGKAGRAPSRPGGVLARARYALQSTRGTWTSVILRKALQNLSPPNLPFGEIATAPQNGFPYRTDLQGRGRIWNLPGDEAPSPACCGDSDTLDVWPEPPFST